MTVTTEAGTTPALRIAAATGNFSANMSSEPALQTLLHKLCALEHETECVEFKVNNANPREIGEYISALANSAALHDQSRGHIVWGVDDKTHAIVGTNFRPRKEKVNGQELESWLTMRLVPRIAFSIHEFDDDGNHIVLFEIPRAERLVVRFLEFAYIRIGSYKNKLNEHPEKEKVLWRKLGTDDSTPAPKIEIVIEQLQRMRDERKSLDYYDRVVAPARQTLEKVHEGYLKTFEQCKELISKEEYPLDGNHPAFERLEHDALFTASDREALLRMTNTWDTNDELGYYARKYLTMTSNAEFDSLGNPMRIDLKTTLAEIFASASDDSEKRSQARGLVNRSVFLLQKRYQHMNTYFKHLQDEAITKP